MISWDPSEYRENGFASMPAALLSAEVRDINSRLDAYLATNDYGVVFEDSSLVPRAVHGLHLADSFFQRLCERSFILDAVESILQRPVYVHQFKVNVKAARIGQSWPWHQDFIFWRELDGIERPDLVNVAIHLSNTDDLSGPLEYFPGSHGWGNICRRTQPRDDSHTAGGSSSWLSNVGRDLTFQASPEEFSIRLAGRAPVAAIRSAGDVDFFHPQLVHGSRQNYSRHDRRLLIITYNAIDNLPRGDVASLRPEFLCSRQFTPVRPYEKSALLGEAMEE